MSRVLIIGASGFIGHYLLENLLGASQHEISATYHTRTPEISGVSWYPMEVTDTEAMSRVFQEAQPEVVVHLAAMADVGQCQRDPRRAREVNAFGTERIAGFCNRYQARMVFISTEYVFAGDAGPYRENDSPGPTTHYGLSKWEAERAVARDAGQWSVLRTSLVYGWPPYADRANLVTRAIDALGSGETFYGHTDMYRSPVYVEDLAEGIAKLAQEHYPGIHHLAGPDWSSMGDFMRTLADVFHLSQDSLVLAPAPIDEPDSPRPRRLGLDSTQTTSLLGFQPRGVASGLEQMQIKRRESPWQQRC